MQDMAYVRGMLHVMVTNFYLFANEHKLLIDLYWEWIPIPYFHVYLNPS